MPQPVAAGRRDPLIWFLAAIVFCPLAVLAWLLLNPASDAILRIPVQHFYIVSAVSILAFLMAGLLAAATVQTGLYRVLFLALGFMSMGGIFSVHGLTTPGVLLPAGPYSISVVGASAFLSLLVPGVFFGLSYAPRAARLERRLPFWPAGWLVVVISTLVIAYAIISVVSTETIAHLPVSQPQARGGLATLTGLLFLYAAWAQWRAYRSARLETQATLVIAFLLLADAQLAMALSAAWTLAWWEYHLLMLAAVTLALRAIALERARGRTLRAILESTLDLEVKVGAEIENVETLATLAAAVELKDREIQGHNVRVAELSVAIGRELGLRTPDLKLLARGGLLHDVGKLGIPDAILHKPGPLDESEWQIIKTHPELGVTIARRAGHLKDEEAPILHHHERMDGSGYPAAIAGEAIPLPARIVAVADTYDVLTSDRPYRKARSQDEALRLVRDEAGTHLDEAVVDALFRVVVPSRAPEGR